MGFSRQYFYKYLHQQEHIEKDKQEVKDLVKNYRKLLPRLGTRKLYHELKQELQAKGIKLGRDGLFTLLRESNMLIKPERRYIQTTMSRHWMRKYPNLIRGLEITESEQVWVGDITYIKTDEGNCYLNLLTDAYSRKIMGYSIQDSMNTELMIKAYQMALLNRKYPERSLIHHTDRGLQYCSKDYIELSFKNRVKISMTEHSDPYENALAERMNRTLKEEFGLGRVLKTKAQAKQITKEAVDLYNNIRPHLALKMNKPEQVH